MKKLLPVVMIAAILILNPVSAADDSIARSAGRVVHDFIDGMAPSAGGAVTIADIDGEVNMIAVETENAQQGVNKIEVSDQDINFILSHVRIRDGVRMYMDNCDEKCVQAVNQAIVRTEGAGLSVVALNSIIEGNVEIANLNSPNGEQYVNHVKIGN